MRTLGQIRDALGVPAADTGLVAAPNTIINLDLQARAAVLAARAALPYNDTQADLSFETLAQNLYAIEDDIANRTAPMLAFNILGPPSIKPIPRDGAVPPGFLGRAALARVADSKLTFDAETVDALNTVTAQAHQLHAYYAAQAPQASPLAPLLLLAAALALG